ncbi:MAG: LamG-like jellyroll fold domain-containing protein [Pseudomonadota bacterium]
MINIISAASYADNDMLLISFAAPVDDGKEFEFFDEAGNSQRATATLQPEYVTRVNEQGLSSPALNFLQGGASSTQVLTGNVFTFSYSEPLTLSFWIKTGTGEQQIVSFKSTASILNEPSATTDQRQAIENLSVKLNTDNQLVLTVSDTMTSESVEQDFSAYINQWTHVSYSVSPEGIWVYINGKATKVIVDDIAIPVSTSAQTYQIGNSTNNIRGAFDDLQVFNRTITSVEADCLAKDGFECVRPISLTQGTTGFPGRRVTQATLNDEQTALNITYDNPNNIGSFLTEQLSAIGGDDGVQGQDGIGIVEIVGNYDEDQRINEVSISLGYKKDQCMEPYTEEGCSKLCNGEEGKDYCKVGEPIKLGNLHGKVNLEEAVDGIGIADIKLGTKVNTNGTCNVEVEENESADVLCYSLTNQPTTYYVVSNTLNADDRFRGLDVGVTNCPMTPGLNASNNLYFKSDSNNIETRIVINEETGEEEEEQYVGVYFKNPNGVETLVTSIPYEDIRGEIGQQETVNAHDCQVTGEDGVPGTEIVSWNNVVMDDNGQVTLQKRSWANQNSTIETYDPIQVRMDGSSGNGFDVFYHHEVGTVSSNYRIPFPEQFDHATRECQVFVAAHPDMEVDDPFRYSADKYISLDGYKDYTRLNGMKYVLVCAKQ